MRSLRSESRFVRVGVGLIAVLTLLTLVSCKKKLAQAPPPPPPAPERPAAPATPPSSERVEEAPPRASEEPKETAIDLDETMRRQNQNKEFLKTVYFDFDKSEIREDQSAILRANAAWMKANPRFRVLIAGHCDERGTIEYNLALGERRAKQVRAYLEDLGIPEDRMRKITYGKERPADPGKDEEAYAKNRRAEFTLEK